MRWSMLLAVRALTAKSACEPEQAVSLMAFRRRSAPVAVLTLAAFLFTMAPRRPAEAAPASPPTQDDRADTLRSGVAAGLASQGGGGAAQDRVVGHGTTTSAGTYVYAHPFQLEAARGTVQPQLGLAYSSSHGPSLAGHGVELTAPSIVLQHTGVIDKWVTSDGEELAELCVVRNGGCFQTAGVDVPEYNLLKDGEAMPPWANGWTYFRAIVERQFGRYFLSPDGRTFRVQTKHGVTREFGAALDGSHNAIQVAVATGKPIRLHLVRAYDGTGDVESTATPRPVNAVLYRYDRDPDLHKYKRENKRRVSLGPVAESGPLYLKDIYDTPPATDAASASPELYAHHTRVTYEPRPDPIEVKVGGSKYAIDKRISRVDVTSKPFASAASARELVRRYHLAYLPIVGEASKLAVDAKRSILRSIQLEGRCSTAVTEDRAQALPETSCPRMPATVLGWEAEADEGTPRDGSSVDRTFIERTVLLPGDINTRLVDLNGDRITDILQTNPATGHVAWLNKGNGTFRNVPIGFGGVLGDTFASVALSNPAVLLADFDGDGHFDLLHAPKGRQAVLYQLEGVEEWRWVGTPIGELPFSLAEIGSEVRVADVDGDGAADLVRTTTDAVETYFSLARQPGGYGRFGSVVPDPRVRDGRTLSDAPARACLPAVNGTWGANFSHPFVKLADLDGDRLPDLVMADRKVIRFWPGQGNGLFGQSVTESECGGGILVGGAVVRELSPAIEPETEVAFRFGDADGDGHDDVIGLASGKVLVWRNDGGALREASTLDVPRAKDLAVDVELADLEGKGVPAFTVRTDTTGRVEISRKVTSHPLLLRQVSNGVGGVTRIRYAIGAGTPGLVPVREGAIQKRRGMLPLYVVTELRDTDSLSLLARPSTTITRRFAYDEPTYDPIDRTFLGFKWVATTVVGDRSSPSTTTRTTYLMGECVDDPSTPAAECTKQEAWRGSPRAALRGLPLNVEVCRADVTGPGGFVKRGECLTTRHMEYALTALYPTAQNRMQRWVRFASLRRTMDWSYEASPGNESPTDVAVTDVVQDGTPEAGTVQLWSATHVRRESSEAVDRFGNIWEHRSEGRLGLDAPIVRVNVWDRPQGERSGWGWRVVDTYVHGGDASPAVRRNWVSTEFDGLGRPVKSRAHLLGTLPLDRFHANGAATAPAPAGASADGEIVSTTTYNALGIAEGMDGPGRRCARIFYDPIYGQFPTETQKCAGGPTEKPTDRMLKSFATYDRGLEVATQNLGFNGELVSFDYDGLGRVVRAYKSDPDNVGTISAKPWMTMSYDVVPDRPYTVTRVSTQDGTGPDSDAAHETVSVHDGFGRLIFQLAEADKVAGDEGQWIVRGYTEHNAKGYVTKSYVPWFYDGDVQSAVTDLTPGPGAKFGSLTYDAFGRVVATFGVDGLQSAAYVYRPLSRDIWDAADLETNGKHAGTPTTERFDGHGRLVATVERVYDAASVVRATVETRATYLPTGETATVTRENLTTGERVSRWMRYDSLGRLVFNVDPDASVGFNPDPATPPKQIKAWRYAYDDVGALVGTSDARGCGVNTTYDAAGRLVAKDVSPCLSAHAPYSAPNLATGEGTELFNRYDTLPVALRAIPGFPVDQRFLAGRLTASYDRGSLTVPRYDARGRVTGVATRPARPASSPLAMDPATGDPSTELEARYAAHWFVQEAAFDAADRTVRTTTGADVDELLGSMGKSEVLLGYTARGVVATVGSSYGPIVARATLHADGRAKETTFGDAAATTTARDYDARLRLKTVQTFRAAAPAWSAPGGVTPAPGAADRTRQLLLESLEYRYDAVNNPTAILDHRDAAEWPAGAKPVSRTLAYDDLYRVTDVSFTHAGGDDAWTSPYAAENTSSDASRTRPGPHVEFPTRIKSQSFRYDWLGNTTQTSDDAHGFLDRSLGTIQNGTAADGPYQLKEARETRMVNGQAPRTGWLSAKYDPAGNLVDLVVQRDGNCLPSWSFCSHRYVYEWDEVGNLARARRWDSQRAPAPGEPVPTSAAQVDLRYVYGAGGQRVVKSARDAQGLERHTVYPLGSLELRRAAWDEGTGDYERTTRTEVVRLAGIGRVVYGEEDTPSAASGRQHVFLNLGGHLGSTETVIDAQTGELVEQTSFQPYGATESDYRPERWKSFREEVKFTGKEEDIEVGLTYFGHRYLVPLLGRWASADPLTIHGLGADLNAYAYVGGAVGRLVDPNGLHALEPGKGKDPAQGGAPTGAGAGGQICVPTGTIRDGDPGSRREDTVCLTCYSGPARPDTTPGSGSGHGDPNRPVDRGGYDSGNPDGGRGGYMVEIGENDAQVGGGAVVGFVNGTFGLDPIFGRDVWKWSDEARWGYGFGQYAAGVALVGVALFAVAATIVTGGGFAVAVAGAMGASAVAASSTAAAVTVAGVVAATAGAGMANMAAGNHHMQQARNTASSQSSGSQPTKTKGHTATYELKGKDGQNRTGGTMRSGSTEPPGRRLTWQEQLNVHTEPKIMDAVKDVVQPGDVLSIEGTLPPCSPGGGGCQSAMQAFATEHQVTVRYTQTGVQSWVFEP